jgi:hypothetical protein
MSATNFLVWNPNSTNQEDDAAYLADPQRSGGAQLDDVFMSPLANKLFYQLSIWVAAFADSLVAKGYSPNDADLAALTAVLANVLTVADITTLGILTTAAYPISIAHGGTGATSFAAAELITLTDLENAPITVLGTTSSPSTSSTSPATLAEMTHGPSTFSGRKVALNFWTEFANSTTGGVVYFQFVKDGTPFGPIAIGVSPTVGQNVSKELNWFDLPSAGSHTYSVNWWVNSGGTTSTAYQTNRSLQIAEI